MTSAGSSAGTKPFDQVLVANRSEIARRIFRSARRMGLRTVAVFTDADTDARFVADADEAIRIPSYLDADAVVAAAVVTGAGAIHPGYGFLAEHATFATAVVDAGLAWVGPAPDTIAAMGDKIRAKELAEQADVPVLDSTDDLHAFASMPLPLLIKAAAGGGGKGMRIVQSADELGEAVVAAQREALTGFGDDRIFAERYVARSRHIEIQVLGDGQGGLVHLGERECSIQRRHQKIIEEAPSPSVADAVRVAMGEAALRLAAALDYRSAGTVEFLVDEATGDFFFLEVNTRLQVEHPVTEAVTGIDLVREQLRIAMGEPLGYDQGSIISDGHAIEARLYAEDPANDFLPATGTLEAFAPATEPQLRWDTGVGAGSVIGTDFDPMIAKIVAHGPSRLEAAGALALGLERLHIGGVTTNRDFLVSVLRNDAFLAGDTTTDFIAREQPKPRLADEHEVSFLAVAAAMWLQADNRSRAHTLGSMPSGWRLGRLPAEHLALKHEDRVHTVSYRPWRDGSFRVQVATTVSGERPDGSPVGPDASATSTAASPPTPGSETSTVPPDAMSAIVHRFTDAALDIEIGQRRVTVRVTRHRSAVGHGSVDRIHATGAAGGVSFVVVPRFSVPEPEVPGGAIVAPMPGRVVELRVSEGDTVEAGQVVAVLEAMKMENHLRAAEAGVVTEVRVGVDDQLEKDTLLIVIDTDGTE